LTLSRAAAQSSGHQAEGSSRFPR